MSSSPESTIVAEAVSDDDDAQSCPAAASTGMAGTEKGPISPPFNRVTLKSDAR